MDLTAARGSLELQEAEKVVFWLLKGTLYRVCSLHSIDLSNLISKWEFDFRKSIREALDIVVKDPSYNTYHNRANEKLNYGRLKADSVKAMVSLCSDM